MKILLTNDDSHRSPLLDLAIRYFSKLGDVSIVVPLHEQSWTGKCVTRFDAVHVHPMDVWGRSALAVGGRPADCVSLGVYNLLDEKPDLVVSGINAGFNIGVGFVLSSGTVGACLEANLAGIPAIALSQMFDASTRDQYIADYLIAPERAQIFESQITSILDKAVGILFSERLKARVLSHPITWNINFPFNLKDPRLLRHARLSKSRYGKCFTESDPSGDAPIRTFHHASIEELRDDTPDGDNFMLRAGVGTLCPIDLWSLSGAPAVDVVQEVISQLE